MLSSKRRISTSSIETEYEAVSAFLETLRNAVSAHLVNVKLSLSDAVTMTDFFDRESVFDHAGGVLTRTKRELKPTFKIQFRGKTTVELEKFLKELAGQKFVNKSLRKAVNRILVDVENTNKMMVSEASRSHNRRDREIARLKLTVKRLDTEIVSKDHAYRALVVDKEQKEQKLAEKISYLNNRLAELTAAQQHATDTADRLTKMSAFEKAMEYTAKSYQGIDACYQNMGKLRIAARSIEGQLSACKADIERAKSALASIVDRGELGNALDLSLGQMDSGAYEVIRQELQHANVEHSVDARILLARSIHTTFKEVIDELEQYHKLVSNQWFKCFRACNAKGREINDAIGRIEVLNQRVHSLKREDSTSREDLLAQLNDARKVVLSLKFKRDVEVSDRKEDQTKEYKTGKNFRKVVDKALALLEDLSQDLAFAQERKAALGAGQRRPIEERLVDAFKGQAKEALLEGEYALERTLTRQSETANSDIHRFDTNVDKSLADIRVVLGHSDVTLQKLGEQLQESREVKKLESAPVPVLTEEARVGWARPRLAFFAGPTSSSSLSSHSPRSDLEEEGVAYDA